ncbi:DNA-binding protein [Xanthomonas cannabis]|uniref:DNA-binding protein n=1 Tax=Xanthomonas cannabis TaxID=1885674 RepID=UPI0033A54F16
MAITQAKQVLQTAPPKAVAAAAARGLRLREQHGRGGTAIGVARARDLSAQKSLSAQTIRRMHSYFARHSVDKNGKGWADAKVPSAGYIAWLLWGGDAGQRWAARLLQRLDAGASKKAGASTSAGGASKTAAKKTSKTRGATSSVTKKTPARKAATKKAATKKAATKKSATKKSATKKAATKKAATNKPARKTSAGTHAAKKASAQRGTASKSATSAKAVKKATARKSAPWKTPNPKSASRSTSLSPAQKSQARKRAKAAGRPYPNLVDNMAVASKRTTKRVGTSGAAKKAAMKK